MRKERKWKIIGGKENFFVFGGISIIYILLLILVYLNFSSVVSETQIEMKFDSEKTFNSIYMALKDSTVHAVRTMQKEGVSAVGIYSSQGKAYQTLGDAPEFLPMDKLYKARQKGEDSTLGILIFSSKDQQIEYFRLSRFIVSFDGVGKDFNVIDSSASPDIIYIRFNSPSYYKKLRQAFYFHFVGCILITCVAGLTISMYFANRRYRQELSKKENLAQLGAAARTLTHEIKNPLSAMTIQSALMRKELPDNFSKDLDLIDHEITRLTNLTNRVSEFLKNPVGNVTDIELVSFIKDIVRLFNTEIKTNFNSISKLYVSFDGDRARSVFENLIKNAAESSKDNNPCVEVDVSNGKKGNVVIKVMDRGDGISESVKGKLFDPFFTTKTYGSGIGLSISKQFVESRGGTLRLYEREGGGTVAEVVLPYNKEVCNESSDC